MPYLAAAVQRAPGLTREDGVERAVDAIETAAREGASLIVFPETWIPAYPYYHGQAAHQQAFRELYRRTFEHSIAIPGEDWSRIAQAAAAARAHVVIGVNEREPQAGTIYNTLAYIGPGGELLGKHRKLVPTLSERLIWGYGDGSDLDVYDTALGRLGGLICYEHQMAPAPLRALDARHPGARLGLAGLGAAASRRRRRDPPPRLRERLLCDRRPRDDVARPPAGRHAAG